jgi:hypothetical protein
LGRGEARGSPWTCRSSAVTRQRPPDARQRVTACQARRLPRPRRRAHRRGVVLPWHDWAPTDLGNIDKNFRRFLWQAEVLRLSHGAFDGPAPSGHQEAGDRVQAWHSADKTPLLDQVVELTGWHRDYARAALRAALVLKVVRPRVARAPTYPPEVIGALVACWRLTRASKRRFRVRQRTSLGGGFDMRQQAAPTTSG